jgi:hypothetical protein
MHHHNSLLLHMEKHVQPGTASNKCSMKSFQLTVKEGEADGTTLDAAKFGEPSVPADQLVINS